MTTMHPWFYTSLLKPAGPKSDGLPILENDSYEVEVILEIKRYGIHAKVKWMGYDLSHNQ